MFEGRLVMQRFASWRSLLHRGDRAVAKAKIARWATK
jgi:hypothetical protein